MWVRSGPDGYLRPVQFLDHLTVIKKHYGVLPLGACLHIFPAGSFLALSDSNQCQTSAEDEHNVGQVILKSYRWLNSSFKLECSISLIQGNDKVKTKSRASSKFSEYFAPHTGSSLQL